MPPSWAARWASKAASTSSTAIDTAIEADAPIVGLWHSGGARLAEGVEALHAVGLVFEAMVRASGLVPQISVVLGFAAGGAAYGPALTDIVIMAPEGRVFVTGPDVVRSVTGEQVDMASLGGPDTHTQEVRCRAHRRPRRGATPCTAHAAWCRCSANRASSIRPRPSTATPISRALLPESAKRAYDVQPDRSRTARQRRGRVELSRNCRAITPAASSPASAAWAAAPSASSPTTRSAWVAA